MSRIDREFIERMRECQKMGTRKGHEEGDRLLIEFIRLLTYTELADEYEKLEKWFA